MPSKTITVTNGDGSTKTITIPDRSRFAGVRTITRSDGTALTVNRLAPVIDSDREGASRPLLSKLVGGASSACSLRDLNDKAGTSTVVKVRREADGEEKDFTAKNISTCGDWSDGKLDTTLPLDHTNKSTIINQFTLVVTSGDTGTDFFSDIQGTYTKGPPEAIYGVMSLSDVWTNENGAKFHGVSAPFVGPAWALMSPNGFANLWAPLATNPWIITGGGGLSSSSFQFTATAVQNVNYTPNPAAAAFSLNRIRSSYVSPAIQIRRGSDNVEADVLFDREGKISNSSPITEVVSETTGTTPHFYVSKANGDARPLNGLRFEKTATQLWTSTTDADIQFQYITPQGQQGFWIAVDLLVTTYAVSAPTDVTTNPNEADWSNTVLSNVFWFFTQETLRTLGDFIRVDDINTQFTFSNTSVNSFDGTYNRVEEDSYVNEKGTTITISGTSFGNMWFIVSQDYNDISYLNVPVTSDPWDATGGSSGGVHSTPDFSLTSSAPVYTVGEDAYVVNWYDQSTNGDDAIQYSASNQPKIASGGSLKKDANDNPAVEWDNVEDNMNLTSDLIATGAYSIFTYHEMLPSTMILKGNINAPAFRYQNNTKYRVSSYPPVVNAEFSVSYPTKVVSVLKDSSNNVRLYSDGTESSSGQLTLGTGSGSNANYAMLGTETGNGAGDGKLFELIYYDTDQTSNRFKIESNINNRYGLYTPTPTNAYVVRMYDQSGNSNDLTCPVANQPQIVNAGRYLGYVDATGSNYLQIDTTLSGSVSCCKLIEDNGVRTYNFSHSSSFPANDNYLNSTKLLEVVYYGRDETANSLAIEANMTNHMDAPVFGKGDYFKRLLTQAVDNHIVGADPATQKELYTTQNHSSSSYVRNANFWLDSHKQALTCISPYNSHENNKRAGVALTPRHVICATHYKVDVGSTIRFVTATNTVVNRTVVGTESIGSSDIEIQILDSDLPSTITPCKVLPSDYTNYLSTVRYMPFLALDQEEKGLVGEIGQEPSTAATWNRYPQRQSSTAQRKSFGEELIGGDSGNPMFFVTKTQLWLFSTAQIPYQGPLLSEYISEINTAINTLDTAQGISSGYTLTEGQWTENV